MCQGRRERDDTLGDCVGDFHKTGIYVGGNVDLRQFVKTRLHFVNLSLLNQFGDVPCLE